MVTYTDVFGGANIYPSEITYSSLALTADVTLSWPEETSASTNLATRIIDITSASSGLSLLMPDASKSTQGNTVLFNNISANSVSVKDSTGTLIMTVGAGTLWQLYLTSNATAAGMWRTLQYGATVSVANAAALAGSGITALGSVLGQSMPVVSINSNYTTGTSDRAELINWTGAAGVLTFPTAATLGNNWFIAVRNSGSGALVLTPSGGNTINGASTLSLQPTEAGFVICDGTSLFTVGQGQPAVFAFDYSSIAVAGTGTYTLSGTELNRVSYKFTGALTGNRTIVVPATIQQYWVDNQTTGSFTLTISSAGGGTNVNVSQGARAILYCDGTNVLDASTAGVSLPLTVSQGGTGATTANGALVNLGGTSTGIAVFTAASTAAVWSALGVAPTGTVNGGTF